MNNVNESIRAHTYTHTHTRNYLCYMDAATTNRPEDEKKRHRWAFLPVYDNTNWIRRRHKYII